MIINLKFSYPSGSSRRKVSTLLVTLLAIAIGGKQAQAQPIVSASDGTGTTVTSPSGNSNQFNIGDGTQAGGNLFHSFTQFNLDQNQVANFLSSPSIQNILARVNGGNASYINGIIQVTGGNSNLYLMNPAGILFGANASLNVPADFIATTANSIGIGSNWFNAYGSNNYATLVGTPNTFAFTMNQPGGIINSSGNLSVKSGQNLIVLGGTVVSTGELKAPGSNITLAAVPGESLIRISQSGLLLSLEIQPITAVNSQGIVPLPANFSPLSLPQLLTGGSVNNSTRLTVNSSGQVVLTGSGVRVENGDVVANSIDTSRDVGNGGSVTINAQSSIKLTGTPLSIDATSANANGGNVILNANGNIAIAERLKSEAERNGGFIRITAGGDIFAGNLYSGARQGNGAAIALNAGGNIFAGNIYSRSTFRGNGGSITFNAGGNIKTGVLFSTGQFGNGGDIYLKATQGNIILEQVFSGTFVGKGGNITLESGGNIKITTGVVRDYFLQQCGSSGAVAVDCGANGSVTLTPTGTTSYPAINVLSLITGKITLIGNKITATPAPNFPVSNLSARDRNGNVSVTNPTQISGVAVQGDGGNINNNAGGDVNTGSTISATKNGNGGAIGIRSDGTINANDLDSFSVMGGNGGNITSTAKVAINANSLDARSLDRIGKDGKIDLTAHKLNIDSLLSNNILVNQQSPNQLNLDDTVLKIEKQRKSEFEGYFGENFSFQSMTAASIRERLGQIENKINQIKPAVVYVTATADRDPEVGLVLLTSSGQPLYRKTQVKQSELERVADLFRQEVMNPDNTNRNDYKKSAQQLYNWLIKPIKSDLQKQGITTLLFSLDAGLRSLPLAALHDGEEFLVEKYSLALIPSVTLTDTRYVGVKNARILAMGRSHFPSPTPNLPAVPVEVTTITQHLWSGKAFLDEAFTQQNLKSQRRQQPFQIIHLATHAEFQPKGHNSYIHLGDGKLNIDKLRDLQWYKPPQVELLVLSACRTALGDEKAEMGFAGLAVQAGVKSALASLWYISDVGTLGLMTEFYQQLKTQPIKAEALRQAQIAMIKGEVEVREGQLHVPGMAEGVSLPPELRTEKKNLSHPYYWAAFTMIGSPW